DRGAHTAVAMDELGAGLLAGLDAWLGAIAPGATRTELRLVAMTVLHLVVRLVLEPAEQFARIYATDDPRDEVVVAWLVRLARGLLRMVDAPDT
ncbi:MAG TPA: hypothetical protein PKA64_18615, partial [Myxococcota bacterium]|nr:hypothetical protein [Myxococcota bacterium]